MTLPVDSDPHCERDNLDEIEVTPEMVEAGRGAYDCRLLEDPTPQERTIAFTEIFRAMYRAMRRR